LGKHIPGRPTVIVRNMPGAGGITQMNYIYNVAPRDGTSIGGTQPGAPFAPLFTGGTPEIKFDPLQFIWLGSPAQFASVAYVWHTAPVKSAQDLMQHELIVGSSGGNTSTEAYLTSRVLGFKYKVITGYSSGADVDLAVQRGEVQGRASIGWTAFKLRALELIKSGQIKVLYQMGLAKHPAIPADVPLILDFARSDADKQVLAMAFAPYTVGYPYLLPPKTPADRVAMLRTAFAETVADPEFKKEAEELNLDVGPVSGERIEAILREAYGAPQDVIQRLRAAMAPPRDADGK
jgi:tripartite-type tricarboxylate transporter receptor subunit TctC